MELTIFANRTFIVFNLITSNLILLGINILLSCWGMQALFPLVTQSH